MLVKKIEVFFMSHQTSHNDRSGTITGALILIGLGTLFLLINAGVLPDWGEIWPAILIVIGLAMLVGSFFRISQKAQNGQL